MWSCSFNLLKALAILILVFFSSFVSVLLSFLQTVYLLPYLEMNSLGTLLLSYVTHDNGNKITDSLPLDLGSLVQVLSSLSSPPLLFPSLSSPRSSSVLLPSSLVSPLLLSNYKQVLDKKVEQNEDKSYDWQVQYFVPFSIFSNYVSI